MRTRFDEGCFGRVILQRVQLRAVCVVTVINLYGQEDMRGMRMIGYEMLSFIFWVGVPAKVDLESSILWLLHRYFLFCFTTFFEIQFAG